MDSTLQKILTAKMQGDASVLRVQNQALGVEVNHARVLALGALELLYQSRVRVSALSEQCKGLRDLLQKEREVMAQHLYEAHLTRQSRAALLKELEFIHTNILTPEQRLESDQRIRDDLSTMEM